MAIEVPRSTTAPANGTIASANGDSNQTYMTTTQSHSKKDYSVELGDNWDTKFDHDSFSVFEQISVGRFFMNIIVTESDRHPVRAPDGRPEVVPMRVARQGQLNNHIQQPIVPQGPDSNPNQLQLRSQQ